MADRLRAAAALLALILFVAGCAPPGASDGREGEGGAVAACAALAPEVARVLRVGVDEVERQAAPGGCVLRAGGGTARLGHFVDVAARLGELLEARGWRADSAHAADGPTGTRAGYRSGPLLALVGVDLVVLDPDACPPDRPIGTCELSPEETRIEARVAIAEADGRTSPAHLK